MDVQFCSGYTHKGAVCCLKFSSDGSLLAVGTDNAVILYNIEQQTQLTFLLGNEQEGRPANHARSVVISPDNKLLVAGSEDKYIRVWNVETGEFLRTLSGHAGEVYALAFTTDSRSLFSASGDCTVRVWDATQFSADVTQVPEPTFRVLHSACPEEKPSKKLVFTSVTVDTTGSFVAAGSLDGKVRVWDVSSDPGNDEPIGILHGHSDGVYSVQFLPSNTEMSTLCLVSASMDRTLKCWELLPDEKRFQCKKTLSGHKDAVLSLSVLQVGREQRLASSSRDGTVRLWDLRSGIPYFMIQGHTNTVTCVDLSSDGTVLASGSGDHQVRIWKYLLQ
ncbi:WD40-repeat-containing domain protein [Boletus edulis BED1]|uniref:WD40-repeat-containing domain protein n=1 Tax=Boletus edulis BED1 TaxID=1328754 RepID=A0AAD4BRT1_BOLED|nr:WD40-repeat-containing domain protein [Boletus edulis BED1]